LSQKFKLNGTNNWPLKPLEEVSEIIAGQSPPSITYNKNKIGLPFYQGKADFGLTFPVARMWCSAPIKVAQTNDILISVRAPVGPTNLCDTLACIGRGLSAIRSNKLIYYKYLFFYLRSIEKMLSDQGRGSTFSAITQLELKQIIIPIPPIQIQKQIAEILEKADQAKQKRQDTNKLTTQFLQSAFIEMFGDPVNNPKGWYNELISEIVSKDKNSIKAGPFGSSLKKEIYVESGYKIYGQEQVIKDDMSYGDYYITEEKYNELKNYSVNKDDVLISLVGTYGKMVIVPEIFHPGIINPRLMKITFDQSKIIPLFFKFIFQNKSFQKLMKNYSHGGTMDILNIGILKGLKLILPPISLQQKFAELVQKVENMKEKQKKSEQELDNLFNCLMQKAFKGDLF
jgi:type I restriction enzyme, S subunit